MSLGPLLSATAIAVGAAALWRFQRRLGETTLIPVWRWAALFWLTHGIWETSLYFGWAPEDEIVRDCLTAAARMLACCPAIALVGVKRPQDRAWGYVVTALWAILVLPAAEAYFLQSGRFVTVGGGRAIFNAILIAMALLNTIFTRYAFAGLCVSIGQCLLLARYTPWSDWGSSDAFETTLGTFAITVGLLIASLQAERSRLPASLDRLWLDFRDLFGLFWSLRVQERLNDAATRYDWSIRLEWGGWVDREGRAITADPHPEELRAILQTFRGLLRRFVSNAWIAERLDRETRSLGD